MSEGPIALADVGLAAIKQARAQLSPSVMHTPLVRYAGSDREIYLKLECLQPIGSFKLRGASNALACADPGQLQQGIVTASAGNMAQGVAWVARDLGLACHVVVPESAPLAKLDAIERLGGIVHAVTFDEWWSVLMTRSFDGASGFFVHPVSDVAVIAGNGTIGLEIVADEPDVATVIAPFGGGGLSSGIACALREIRPAARVFAAEVATAAPFAASLARGEASEVDYRPSFIDGIGGKCVLPEMWPLVSERLAGSLVVDVEAVASALRSIVAKHHVVAEGAGAAALAAALAHELPEPIVCVVSGGNIDSAKLATLLRGELPQA